MTQFPWEMPRFRAWVAVARVHQLAKRALTERLSDVGLELPHYDILAAVFRFPQLTQQELADKLLIGRSNLSMLLPELERRGLIRRELDETDKRVRRLSLTPDGEAQVREGLAIQTALIEGMLHDLSDAECDTIGALMRRIAVLPRR